MKRTLVAVLLVMLGNIVLAGEVPDEKAILEWSELPSLPDPEGFAGAFAGVSNDALIVAGGANFPKGRPWEELPDGSKPPKVWYDSIFVLDEVGGEWRTGFKLPRPAGYGVSVTTDEGLLCIGGCDADECLTGCVLLRWNADEQKIEREEYPPLPKPCAFMGGALVDDVVYIAGGQTSMENAAATRNFFRLDLSRPEDEREWVDLDTWPEGAAPRLLPVVASQNNGFNRALYFFSGRDVGHGDVKFLKDAWSYDPKKEEWEALAPCPAAVCAGTGVNYGPAFSILVFGGADGSMFGEDLREKHPGFPKYVHAYHTVTDTWVKLKNEMPLSFVTSVAVQWGDRIVITSGEIHPGIRSPKVLQAGTVQAKTAFGAVNWAVLGGYLSVLVLMGFYFSKREKSTEDFFLAGRRIPWWAAGLSIYGTQLSAITFMAIPATVFSTNWVRFFLNMTIIAIAPAVVFLYLPFFRRLNVTTAYEYLEKRFGVVVRLYGSLAFIVYQLGRMSIVLLLPAIALAAATGMNIYACIILMGVLCTIYTVLGGIEAVVWTDVLQVLVLLGGAIVSLFVIGASLDGGLSTVFSTGFAEGKFHLANFTADYTTMSLWVIVVGGIFMNLVPYTTDQAVIQRYLTTKDEKSAARGIWTNAALILPGSLIFFTIGVALFVFFKSSPELMDPRLANDATFPLFIAHHLPQGIAGLVIAGVFAASMSSLDSSMNSVATAMVTDFYRRFKPDAEDHKCLLLARALTVILGVLATGASLILAGMEKRSLWDTFNAMVGLLGGGLAGLFLLGIFTRKAVGAGALIGAVVATALTWYAWWQELVHGFLFAAIGIVTCVVVGYVLSTLLGGTKKDIDGLTIHTLKKETRAEA